MKKKSKLTSEYRRLCEKLFDIKLKIKQIEDNSVCICDKCQTVIDEFDPARVYKEVNIQIYDKWYCWYYLCECGNKIYLKGDMFEFFRNQGMNLSDWEKQNEKTNTETKYY